MAPVSQKPLNCVSRAPQFVVAPTAALRERPAAVLEAIAVAAGAPCIARRFQRRADDPLACIIFTGGRARKQVQHYDASTSSTEYTRSLKVKEQEDEAPPQPAAAPAPPAS